MPYICVKTRDITDHLTAEGVDSLETDSSDPESADKRLLEQGCMAAPCHKMGNNCLRKCVETAAQKMAARCITSLLTNVIATGDEGRA